MRTEIRREIDITKPLNLRRLSSMQKILVAIRKELSESNFAMNSRRRLQQEAHRRMIVKEDHAKETILTEIYQELVLGKSTNGIPAKEIIITVSVEYRDVIFDKKNSTGEIVRKSIFSHSDFSQYSIMQIPENADIRKAFSTMPYLFRVRRKVLS